MTKVSQVVAFVLMFGDFLSGCIVDKCTFRDDCEDDYLSSRVSDLDTKQELQLLLKVSSLGPFSHSLESCNYRALSVPAEQNAGARCSDIRSSCADFAPESQRTWPKDTFSRCGATVLEVEVCLAEVKATLDSSCAEAPLLPLACETDLHLKCPDLFGYVTSNDTGAGTSPTPTPTTTQTMTQTTTGGRCEGSVYQCYKYSSRVDCSHQWGCSWYTDSSNPVGWCSGSAQQCNAIYAFSSCVIQEGCAWKQN